MDELSFGDYVLANGILSFVVGSGYETGLAEVVPVSSIVSHLATGDELVCSSTKCSYDKIQMLQPVQVSEETLRSLFRLDVLPFQLAEQVLFPIHKDSAELEVQDEDLQILIDHLATYRFSESVIDGWTRTFLFSDYADRIRYPDSQDSELIELRKEVLSYLSELDPLGEIATQGSEWYDELTKMRQ